jgi:hypothetical protein
MMAHSSALIPQGLQECEKDPRLPELGAVGFVLLEKKADRKFLAEMSLAIRKKVATEI